MYRILSVEDDPMMQKLLQAALVSASYEFRLSPTVPAPSRQPWRKSRPLSSTCYWYDAAGIEVCRALKADRGPGICRC